MNILITGATGFIGSHITQALIQEGHRVRACVRNPAAIHRQWPNLEAVKVDFNSDHQVSDWIPRLENIDIVINSVGIIRETATQTFDALHTAAPCALFMACEQAGVEKVIQISALGADITAFSQYHRSKRAADECLMALALDWAILLPSITYGPGAKSMALFRALASLPLVPLVDKGDQPVQPVHVEDLVRTVMRLIQPETPNRIRIELVGPRAISLKEISLQLRHWLGLGKARFVHIPYRLALLAGRVGGFLGNTPMTAETIQMLRRGNTADVDPFVKQFGFIPISFEESLADTPSQQADRWHAGLCLLRPILRLSIAFLWIITGVVSAFIFPTEQSYGMLAEAGITGIWSPILLYGAATTDFALGMATLFAVRLPLVGLTQILVILLYSVIITFSQPQLWAHPFGPVTKNLPLLIATLVMLVLERR